MDPESNDTCPNKRQKRRDLETQRERHGRKVKAETGVMHLQAKERRGLPATLEAGGEARKRVAFRISTRNHSCRYLCFRLLASRSMWKHISVFKVTQFVVMCYGNPWKLIQSLKRDEHEIEASERCSYPFKTTGLEFVRLELKLKSSGSWSSAQFIISHNLAFWRTHGGPGKVQKLH